MKRSRKRMNWAILLVVVLILLAAAAYVWVFAFDGLSHFTENEGQTDGRISYNADAEIEKAREQLAQTAEQSNILASDSAMAENKVVLAFYGLSNRAVNDEVLQLLEKYDCTAAFFLNGVESADNSELVQAMDAGGHTLGSTGLHELSQAHTQSQDALVDSLVRSRKVLTTLTDSTIDLLFCPNTVYTPQLRHTAFACGFTSLAAPAQSNLLDWSTFSDKQAVEGYLTSLENGTLLMIRIDGRAEIIPDIPVVNPDVPTIDKQPDAELTTDETMAVSEENCLQMLKWLLEIMQEEQITAADIRTLPTLDRDPRTADAQTAVYERFLTNRSSAALALWGLSDDAALEQAVKLLKDYGADATFFVTEQDLSQRQNTLKTLVRAGFQLGVGGEDPGVCGATLEAFQSEKLMVWLPVAQVASDKSDVLQTLEKTAAADGYDIVLPSASETVAPGALLGFDLTQADALTRLEETLISLESQNISAENVGSLLVNSGSITPLTQAEVKSLREQNAGECAQPVSYVQTTERALSMLFYGVSNNAATQDVCRVLESHDGSKGTFFVTVKEIMEQSDLLRQLIQNGHEVGIAYVENSSYPATFDSVVRYINSCQQLLRWQCGTQASLVFLPYGEANEEVMEAVSAMGCGLAAANIRIVQSAHENLTVEEIPDILATDLSRVHVTRGSQVYLNLIYYVQDQDLEPGADTVAGAMLDAVFQSFIDPIAYSEDAAGEMEAESRYVVKTCSQVRSSPLCYTLPEVQESLAVSDSNHVLFSMDAEEQDDYIVARYIGTPASRTYNELPDFGWNVFRQLDKIGRLTDDKVLFLTFDDWGDDATLNHLLYVLKKNDVKATFFVRTNHVESNPNLLRAIAMDGHTIAAHSHEHLTLASQVEGRQVYKALTQEQAAQVRADAVECYQTLYKYVGDVVVDGKPALSTVYRPPTLAVSREGLEQILDVGYSYIVSGDFSTHDYEATSPEDLVRVFNRGLIIWGTRHLPTNGSVLVMHMSPGAQYTAQALDEMIPIWKEQGYQFADVTAYLSTDSETRG